MTSSLSSTAERDTVSRETEKAKERGLTVTTVLLSLLVRCPLNLDSNTSTRLVLLDDVLRLVVELERSTAQKGKVSGRKKQEREGNAHLPKLDHLSLLRLRVDLDYTQRCTDAESTVDDVDTEDDS
jgi:hypothetical protein